MRFNHLLALVPCVFSAAVAYVALGNLSPHEFLLFGRQVELAPGLASLISLAIGVWAGRSLAGLLPGEGKIAVTNQRWAQQDAKLMAEVSSDRERQLESKIATLEAALKTALKKSG